jgi:hypothetical protein
MRIQVHTAFFVLIRHGRIRTSRIFDHGEIRLVRVSDYLRFRIKNWRDR